MEAHELAKQVAQASLEELRFVYESSGGDHQRYEALKLTVARSLLEKETDSAFVDFCRARHGMFKPTEMEANLIRVQKLMNDPEAMKTQAEIVKRLHDMDDHEH